MGTCCAAEDYDTVVVGETAWQLLQVQTVYGCNVTVIAIFHSISFHSLVHVIQFFQLREWGFPARGSNCLLLVLLLKWNRSHSNNGSLHYTIGFYCCHVTTFWNLIGTANFQAAKITVWTRASCQAVSPMAWERGLFRASLFATHWGNCNDNSVIPINWVLSS